MSDIAVKLENISKQYRLGVVGTGTLSHDINRWWARIRGKDDPSLKIGQENTLAKAGGKYVWALKDIDFEIKKGEVLGIIGKNGAGKSTLLKILSRVTGPTTGFIKVNGRLASLLEVGTGFHPELTGRENIFLNGAILGMTKSEINKQLDEIIDFAGIAKYVDTPVKRYSSGMYVRLGFAVAAHLNSEILVVDEVLAVGDAEFQKKAIGKMQDISKGEGRTVLFVSHNMASVKALCTRGVLLENGRINENGDVGIIIENYLLKNNKFNNSSNSLLDYTQIQGNKKILFTKVIMYKNNKESDVFNSNDQINIDFYYSVKEEVDKQRLIFVVTFFDRNENLVLRFDTREIPSNFTNMPDKGKIRLNIPAFCMREGEYFMKIWLSETGVEKHNCVFALKRVAVLNIIPTDYWKIGKQNFKGAYPIIDGSFSINK